MKKILWIGIFLLILFLIGFASDNFQDMSFHRLNIIIETNGTTSDIKISNFFINPPPPEMLHEISNYVSAAIYDPDSTVESIKENVKNIAEKYGYKDVNVKIISQFGEDELPMFAIVSGDSMYPTLKNGQEIIAVKTKDFKVGDIVIAKHPVYGLIVKRVGKIEGDMVYLVSDNKSVKKIYLPNEVITETPLNTWLPRSNVIGVVKQTLLIRTIF